MSTQKISHEKEIAEIWKLFRETDRKMQEMSQETERVIKEMSRETDRKMQETDRIIKEMSRETERVIKEMSRETDRKMQESAQQMKKTRKSIQSLSEENKKSKKQADKRIKELNNLFTGQWGKLMESLVEGDLIKLLKEHNIKVEATLTNLKSKHAEFDIIAVNGQEVVVVEVKTTLKVGDVDHFINNLKNFTKWRTEYKNKIIYGAVAYLKANQNSDKYAETQKLFVIRATGSSASIINAKNFKPRIFS